jgi:hypothetical protein
MHDINNALFLLLGTRWRSWLRHCATSPKAAGSIPDGKAKKGKEIPVQALTVPGG